MRKVKFNIHPQKDFRNEGYFHQWAAKSEELASGYGNYTIALVETENGEIKEIFPTNLKFIDNHVRPDDGMPF